MKLEIVTQNLCIAWEGGNLKISTYLFVLTAILTWIICYYFSPNILIFILSSAFSTCFITVHVA